MDYKPVKLDPADAAKLRAHNDKVSGVNNFVTMVTQSGEARLAKLQEEGRALFEEFDAKYKLDVEHVQYIPSRDGGSLVPQIVRLVNE